MRILLVEDDSSIQAIAKMALTRVGGHQVFCAKDGIETLEIIETESIDLILLDIMMPRKNGFDTCKAIKNNPKTSWIPIIFLTAKAQTHEMQHGMSLGALGYIFKPFDPMTLPEQIKTILETHAAT